MAIVLALTMRDTVYSLVSYAWSGIGSSFGPALILLLFWKKLSRAGVFASLITGTVATVVWKTFLEQPTGVSERLASYVISFAMAVLFSLLFPEKKGPHPAFACPVLVADTRPYPGATTGSLLTRVSDAIESTSSYDELPYSEDCFHVSASRPPRERSRSFTAFPRRRSSAAACSSSVVPDR